MNCFSIRLHDASEKLFDSYLSVHDSGDIFIVKELTKTNKKVHYQSYFRTDTKKDCISKRFSRLKIKGGNSDEQYAVTTVKDTDEDRERIIQYLCKGESKDEMPIVLHNSFLTEEQIKNYHDNYWEENAKLPQGKKKERGEIKKSGFQEALDFVNYHRGVSEDAWLICELLIKYYTVNCKCEPNDFQLKNMTKSIIAQIYYNQRDDNRKFERWCKKRSKDIIGSEFKYDL